MELTPFLIVDDQPILTQALSYLQHLENCSLSYWKFCVEISWEVQTRDDLDISTAVIAGSH